MDGHYITCKERAIKLVERFQMPLSRWETMSEPFSTTEPTEITERGHWFEYLAKKCG
jgi:hypothetical protein